MKFCCLNTLLKARYMRPPPSLYDDCLFYEVEYVLKRRTIKKGKRVVKQYGYEWTGCTHEHITWEPEKNT